MLLGGYVSSERRFVFDHALLAIVRRCKAGLVPAFTKCSAGLARGPFDGAQLPIGLDFKHFGPKRESGRAATARFCGHAAFRQRRGAPAYGPATRKRQENNGFTTLPVAHPRCRCSDTKSTMACSGSHPQRQCSPTNIDPIIWPSVLFLFPSCRRTRHGNRLQWRRLSWQVRRASDNRGRLRFRWRH